MTTAAVTATTATTTTATAAAVTTAVTAVTTTAQTFSEQLVKHLGKIEWAELGKKVKGNQMALVGLGTLAAVGGVWGIVRYSQSSSKHHSHHHHHPHHHHHHHHHNINNNNNKNKNNNNNNNRNNKNNKNRNNNNNNNNNNTPVTSELDENKSIYKKNYSNDNNNDNDHHHNRHNNNENIIDTSSSLPSSQLQNDEKKDENDMEEDNEDGVGFSADEYYVPGLRIRHKYTKRDTNGAFYQLVNLYTGQPTQSDISLNNPDTEYTSVDKSNHDKVMQSKTYAMEYNNIDINENGDNHKIDDIYSETTQESISDRLKRMYHHNNLPSSLQPESL